jgi:hypothetical protein
MIDVDFPFQFDASGHTASTDRNDHVRDMIEQVLLTSAGERVNRPDFGSGLLQMVFAPNSPELAAAIQFTSQGALQRWMGDLIDLVALDVVADDSALRVTVRYVVRRTGDVRIDTFERVTG